MTSLARARGGSHERKICTTRPPKSRSSAGRIRQTQLQNWSSYSYTVVTLTKYTIKCTKSWSLLRKLFCSLNADCDERHPQQYCFASAGGSSLRHRTGGTEGLGTSRRSRGPLRLRFKNNQNPTNAPQGCRMQLVSHTLVSHLLWEQNLGTHF